MVKDTAKEGESSTHYGHYHDNQDSHSLEEKVKLFLGEFGSKEINKSMDLTQSKHTKCLCMCVCVCVCVCVWGGG